MNGLTLDQEKHEYRWQGVVVPSVTQILKVLGLSKSFDGVDPFYAQRGIATHKAIELYLKGELDEATVDDVYKGYYESFKRWWEKEHFTTCATEVSLYSQRLEYAGTLDLVVDGMIIDFKTSKEIDPATEIQGAGQQILYGEVEKVLLPFRALQLFGKGDCARLVSYDPISPNLWDAVMEIFGWYKKAHPRSFK